jgi:hypothetical protein
LLTFSLPVPEGRLMGSERINAFYRELLDRVRAAQACSPLRSPRRCRCWSFGGVHAEVVGRPAATTPTSPGLWSVARAYFETFGIPLARGRAFTSATAGSQLVVIVNEAFVRRFLPESIRWPSA